MYLDTYESALRSDTSVAQRRSSDTASFRAWSEIHSGLLHGSVRSSAWPSTGAQADSNAIRVSLFDMSAASNRPREFSTSFGSDMRPALNLSISSTIRPIKAACHGSMRVSVGSPPLRERSDTRPRTGGWTRDAVTFRERTSGAGARTGRRDADVFSRGPVRLRRAIGSTTRGQGSP